MNKDMKRYKGILIAKGSDLYEALEVLGKCKPNTEPEKLAREAVRKISTGTEERFNKLYPKEDRDWFYSMHNLNKA